MSVATPSQPILGGPKVVDGENEKGVPRSEGTKNDDRNTFPNARGKSCGPCVGRSESKYNLSLTTQALWSGN